MVPVKIRYLFLCAALLTLLTGCDSDERIRTHIPSWEHVSYVELSDGYLYFNVDDRLYEPTSFHAPGATLGEISREYALDLLRFDPVAATTQLPEHLQFSWEDLVSPAYLYTLESGEVLPAGGLQLKMIGEVGAYFKGKPAERQKLTLYCNRSTDPRDKCFPHVGARKSFIVVPWNRYDESFDRYYDFTCEKSMVGDLEVGLCYDVQTAALWPDAPDTVYYAGFYIGDRAYGLESHYGYCTQEEFIQVLLAIIDAAVAAQET